ncbi:IS200/IS605 family element transposase accessory protein TnpB [Streptomyces sp. A7024]|uniref:IS200/IS605 family element transposase accessory protein TnpB n=1 Tax=Streptomyces coryli TaxID=1128680 RepID=A0A6G4U2X6_9ACTN|nr:IS200/IS605 family element transposase accessory protein TnpB [Streptomyces coryli]
MQVKLMPTSEEAAALEATLRTVNRAADHTSATAFATGKTSRNDLQREVYSALKAEFGLSAQAAVRTVKKVVDAYATLRANIKAGNLGPPGTKRRRKAESKPIAFRLDAAQPYDDRILSWQHDAATVSIWTTAGRIKGVRYTGHPDHLKTLREYRKGESDLVHRDGKWFLVAVCEVPEEPRFEPVDWIGVDRGIANLATTSDGTNYQGRRLGRYRRHHARKRAELQAKMTHSAKRRARRRARKEQRHAANQNHKISKEIVAIAQRTGRGIAVEDLGSIRDRVRPRRDQRAMLSSWPFRQLEEHLRYKARRAGVPVIAVDARYTSQRCPRCGHTERANRRTRDHFCCRRCGLAGPADHVAGVNVRNRARSAWVLVNGPVPQRT